MITHTYNGYRNWETWNIVLYIDNTYKNYKEMCRFAAFNEHLIGTAEFGNAVVDKVTEMYPAGTPDMDSPSDMDKVYWPEIIDHIATYYAEESASA